MTKYAEAFDYFLDFGIPRRKHSPDPEHWLWRVYSAGVRLGIFCWRVTHRTPLTIFFRGFGNGWGED